MPLTQYREIFLLLQHRPFFYWILTIGVFVLTAVCWFIFKPTGKHESTIEPQNITTSIEVPIGRYYQTDGRYHLDMTGTTQMILPFKNLPKSLSDYDFFVVSGLDSEQSINLFITAQLLVSEQSAPVTFKQKLITHRQSINKLNEPWPSAVKISALALIVESEISLGFGPDFNNEVSWQLIQLTDSNQINQSTQLFSELFAFVPLSYSSINIHNGENLFIYKSLLSWLAVWILICTGAFLIIKPAMNHLVMSIALAWFSAGLVYGSNFVQQASFNQQRFAGHDPYLNRIDQGLKDIANRIDKAIKSQSHYSSSNKILIIGGENFNNKRLKFHLLHHNVGIIGRDISQLKDHEYTNDYAVLLPPFNEACEPDSQNTAVTASSVVLKSSQFCLIAL